MTLVSRALAIGLLVVGVGCDRNPAAPQAVVNRPGLPAVAPGQFTRVEGAIAELGGRCPGIRFVIGSFHILTNSTTLFQRASCESLTNGSVVDVTGARQPDGTLFAQEVEARRR